MSAPIFAEVADKEPTLTLIWCITGVLSVLGFLFCRWCKSAAALALVFAVLWTYGAISELQDANTGPAIVNELGQNYVIQTYIAALIPWATMLTALWLRNRKHEAS